MQSVSRAPLSLVVGPTRSEITDAELARSLGAGEAWAMTETWYRFAAMVTVTAERVLGSRFEAEDVAQEVFVRVFQLAKTLRQPESLRSLVYSVAIRALRSELRRRRLRAWLTFHEPLTLVDLRHTTFDADGRDLLRKFYALLDRLSARDRLVFILRRVDSMTVEEIAAALELSTSTVKRSMTRATSRLSHWVDADAGLKLLIAERAEGKS